MEEIIDEGHAAILVSHTMSILQRMSQVWTRLRRGRVEMFGPSHEVVSQYEKQTTHEVVSNLEKQTAQSQDAAQSEPVARLCSWKVESKVSKDPHTIVCAQERVTFHFEVELAVAVPNGKHRRIAGRCPGAYSEHPLRTAPADQTRQIFVGA